MKVALYLRVSTARQAEKDLSIPDQRNQLERWAKDKGWQVVAEYVEPGASATDDKRPQFQRMMDDAARADRPFDVVLVHSFSRFFRDSFQFELHRRSLEKNNVALISITQAVTDDPGGQMFRQLCAMFDEYQSRENAKHVLRAMKENARQGFWNGAKSPFGYKAVVVETRADAIKKQLAVEPAEAAIVRMVFDMYRAGKGVRVIAHEFNRQNITHRGGKFTSTRVHEILTREAYAGRYYFNRKEWRTGKRKERGEWIEFETPVIIEPHVFQAVQGTLESRRPTRVPPRVLNGPTLLTGIAKCATCGGGMTLRTGKGGRYRYYACHNAMNKGKSACRGRSIPMADLDNLVLGEVEQKILAPERLEVLLSALIARAKNRTQDDAAKAQRLRKALAVTEGKIERLYGALAEGTVKDTDLFRKSLSRIEAERDEALRLIGSLEQQRSVPKQLLSRKNLARFAIAARERLHAEDARLRKGYVRQIVERVEVADGTITVRGSKAALASGLLPPAEDGAGEVPRFVPEWWAVTDSNRRHPACKAGALPTELTAHSPPAV
jgi:site-specific DNA recombinase